MLNIYNVIFLYIHASHHPSHKYTLKRKGEIFCVLAKLPLRNTTF